MNRRYWYLLLTLPILGTLFPPFYNRVHPTLFGLQFFYWYQLAWVVATAVLLWLVFVLTREPRDV